MAKQSKQKYYFLCFFLNKLVEQIENFQSQELSTALGLSHGCQIVACWTALSLSVSLSPELGLGTLPAPDQAVQLLGLLRVEQLVVHALAAEVVVTEAEGNLETLVTLKWKCLTYDILLRCSPCLYFLASLGLRSPGLWPPHPQGCLWPSQSFESLQSLITPSQSGNLWCQSWLLEFHFI